MAGKRAFPRTSPPRQGREGRKEEGQQRRMKSERCGGFLETREEITVKHFWSIFIVGVPQEKKKV